MKRKELFDARVASTTYKENSFAVHVSKRGRVRGLHSAALQQKKLQNLRPAASKVIILRLRHHQDN